MYKDLNFFPEKKIVDKTMKTKLIRLCGHYVHEPVSKKRLLVYFLYDSINLCAIIKTNLLDCYVQLRPPPPKTHAQTAY